jgi:hypothetical protein
MRANKLIETQEAVESSITGKTLQEYQAEFANLEFEYERAKEHLASLDIMLDNQGWTEILGGALPEDGPTLEQIRFASQQLRELTAVNAHLKRGNLLRANYVLEGGIHYEGVSGGRGAGNKNIRGFIDNAQNQREYFGVAARKKRMKARYTDGHVLWIGNDTDKTLKMVPFEKITGTLTNPEDSTEIWALRILRQVNRNNADPKLEPRWIFLDEFVDKRVAASLVYEKNREMIDKNSRIFLEIANPTVGWRWGTPDALAAMAWVRQYREFLISGKKMSDAMAMLWGQYKNSQAGAQNAAVAVGGTKQGAGGTAFGGGEYNIFNTAGKSYDFDAGRPLLAAAATSLEVSVVALASDPGAAGSSYGSAQTLDLPGRIAISAIREEIAEFDVRVLKWLGAANPTAWFDSLLDADQIYRLVQAEMLYWATGLRKPEEQKREMDKIKGKPTSDAIPDGIMTPNNTNFPGTLSNDSQPTQQASPDQGQSNGSGGAGNLGNQRRDTISN